MKRERFEVIRESGNVYRDLGKDNPDLRQFKAILATEIIKALDFGFHKITVERPLRLNFQASAERIARLEDESSFKNLATSSKKSEKARLEEIAAGERRQEEMRLGNILKLWSSVSILGISSLSKGFLPGSLKRWLSRLRRHSPI